MSEGYKLTKNSPEVIETIEHSGYAGDCALAEQRPVLFYKLFMDIATNRTDKSDARAICSESGCHRYRVLGKNACTLTPLPEGNAVNVPLDYCFLQSNRPGLYNKIKRAKSGSEIASAEKTRGRKDCRFCGNQESCEVYQRIAYERHNDSCKYDKR